MVIFGVVPRITVLNHLQIDELVFEVDGTQYAAVLISFVPTNPNFFAHDQIIEVLFGNIPVGLVAFWGVDTEESDFFRGSAVEHGNRIAISDFDDFAGEADAFEEPVFGRVSTDEGEASVTKKAARRPIQKPALRFLRNKPAKNQLPTKTPVMRGQLWAMAWE